MKKRYILQVSERLNRKNTYGLMLVMLTALFQLCTLGSKAQTAYWLESVNNNVKKIDIASPPVAAGGATTLATPSIPLYIFQDNRNGLVYWSDAGTGSIKRVSTSGGAVTDVVTGITGSGIYPRGIYVDITNNMLYWAETAPGLTDVIKKISIASGLPKASSTGTSVVTAIDIVRGITVDSVANLVYFADAGAGGSGTGIYRASTTGPTTEAASTKVAVVTAGAQPNSLSIDRTNNFIYWCEFTASGKIQRAATNVALPATTVNVYTGSSSIRGMSLDLNSNTVYWAEYPSLTIKKADLSTIPIVTTTNVVTGLLYFPRAVQVVSISCINVGIGSVSAGGNPICSNATTTLTANGVTGTNALVTWWTGPGGTGTNLGTGTTLPNRGPGTYYARVTGDCGTPAEASIAITSKVNVGIGSVSAGSNPICSNATTTLTANGVTGDNAVVTWWSGPGGTGTNLGTGTTLPNRGPGTYYARVTGDCGTPAEASIIITSKVNVGIGSVSAGNNPICSNATTTLTANGVTGTSAVVTWWTGSGGTGTNLGTGTTLLNRGPGTYYARVTGDCGTAVEGFITVNSVTGVGIGSVSAGSNPICSNATTTLTANGVTGANAVVTWWTGPGGTGTNLGTGTTLPNRGPGTYYARVTGDCGTPVEASITVNSITAVGIGSVTALNNPICPNTTTSITANTITGANAVLTWWTGSGGTGTNLGGGNPLVVGVGTYYARITGDCGTPAEASITINPTPPPVCDPLTDRIYVDINNCSPGNGSSWACAINQLSSAITMANANMAIKSIWVADGTYKPGTARTDVLAITRADLMILGGFAGGEVSAMDANPAANPTIISGDIGTLMDASDNSYRLMNIGGSPVSANPLVVDGFIFENGNANGAGDKAVGAAILSNGIPVATPIWIKRNVFRNNNAVSSGGAVYLTGANLAFDGCRFVSNTAGSTGGAVFSFQASPTFNNTVFVGNTAPNGGGYYGNYGYPKFNKTVFTGNSATYGGGVYQNRMGADYFNCVFNANTSNQGGAIYEQSASTSHILNSTFFKNTGVSYGGAIVLTGSNSSTVTENSIFWKNTHAGSATSPWADFVNYTAGANVYANNILQLNTSVPADNGTTRRFNKRGVDPLFVNEASPVGADVMWGTADDGLQLQDCAVSSGPGINAVSVGCSPAINAGDNAPVGAAGLTTDERNNPRIVCSIVDMGAYENQNCGVSITSAEQQVISMAKTISTNSVTGIVANPFENDLQIRYTGTEKAGVTVYAATGKAMWSKSNITEGITHVNSSSWTRGIYQVVIVTATGKRLNFKVVRL